MGKNSGTSNPIQNKSTSDKTPAETPPPSINNQNQSDVSKTNTPDKTSQQKEESTDVIKVAVVNNHRDWIDYISISLTFALTAATLILAIYAGVQAKAAKASADSLINSDRAWVLIDKIDNNHLLASGVIGETTAYCFIKFNNFGKTPAKMTVCHAEIQVGDSRERPNDVSIYTRNGLPIITAIQPQGDPFDQRALLTTHEGFLVGNEPNEVMHQRKFLWLCGVIRYQDVFREKPDHETRFCYLYEVPPNVAEDMFVLAGPKEYNAAT